MRTHRMKIKLFLAAMLLLPILTGAGYTHEAQQAQIDVLTTALNKIIENQNNMIEKEELYTNFRLLILNTLSVIDGHIAFSQLHDHRRESPDACIPREEFEPIYSRINKVAKAARKTRDEMAIELENLETYGSFIIGEDSLDVYWRRLNICE